MKTIHREKVSLQQCLSTCSLRRLNTVKFFRAFSPLAPRLSNGKQQQVFSESCLHIKAFVATQRDSRFVFFSLFCFPFSVLWQKASPEEGCLLRGATRDAGRQPLVSGQTDDGFCTQWNVAFFIGSNVIVLQNSKVTSCGQCVQSECSLKKTFRWSLPHRHVSEIGNKIAGLPLSNVYFDVQVNLVFAFAYFFLALFSSSWSYCLCSSLLCYKIR